MFFEEKIEEINHILKKLKNGKTAVWCLGIHTEKLLEYTDLLKYDIKFFIDRNAQSYRKQEAYGKPVYKIEEADFQGIDHIVLSTYRYQKQILSDLNRMGLSERAIALYTELEEGEFYLLPKKDNADFYFTGNFADWRDARQSVTGYEDAAIAQKVLEATKQVMEKKACFERDSVLFYKPEYNFKLIALFGLLASRNSSVNIVDFGGALGSEYWRNREFFYQFGVDFTWNIVEQDTYVTLGKKEVSNKELRFYNNVSQLEGKTDLVLLSSVLQYLPDYKSVLSELMDLEAEYILIERQVVSEQSRICVQYVGENIYSASYPLRILDEKELMDLLDRKYRKITEFVSEADEPRAYVDGKEFYYKGYLMERKRNENT